MKKRHTYLAGPAGKDAPKPWKVTYSKEIRGYYDTQRDAIHAASTMCRVRWEQHGELCELKIARPNGVIRDSRTYGKDPRDIPG